ncbi:MAG: hypothetical protein Q8K35_05245 [Thiobacillus sp.]|nr:hypothetical protein [Thiobacillus sp.]
MDFAASVVAQPRFAGPQAAANRRRNGLAPHPLFHFRIGGVLAQLHVRDVVLHAQSQQFASRRVQVDHAARGICHGDVIGGFLEDGQQTCLHALAELVPLLFQTHQALELFVETPVSGLGLLEVADVAHHHHRMQFIRLLQVARRPSQGLHTGRHQASRMPLRLLSTTVVLTRGEAELGIKRWKSMISSRVPTGKVMTPCLSTMARSSI